MGCRYLTKGETGTVQLSESLPMQLCTMLAAAASVQLDVAADGATARALTEVVRSLPCSIVASDRCVAVVTHILM
eukprot:COSAG05_NODE_105_length_18793_cov_115.346421_20_plen_75_part_00